MDILNYLVNSPMILRLRLCDVYVLLRHFCAPDDVCRYIRAVAMRVSASCAMHKRYSVYLHKYIYSFASTDVIIEDSNDIVVDWFRNVHVVLKDDDGIAARSQLSEKLGDVLVSYYNTFYH